MKILRAVAAAVIGLMAYNAAAQVLAPSSTNNIEGTNWVYSLADPEGNNLVKIQIKFLDQTKCQLTTQVQTSITSAEVKYNYSAGKVTLLMVDATQGQAQDWEGIITGSLMELDAKTGVKFTFVKQ
jgi:hypothetical protein